jgi:hypothetical protein
MNELPADLAIGGHERTASCNRRASALARALFVDFECLKGSRGQKPHPALLGVLVGADGESFAQIITDERLAPARVAQAQTRAMNAPDAVDALVARAVAEDRQIVAWSVFDRDRMIDACPNRAEEIEARYVNALQVARPWGRTIHPSVRIEREGPLAPKHTLEKYAHLARYPVPTGFATATPAKWIRHTLGQLRANAGRYRRTTPQTKRDWHKLLDYNRHDCLALRHIILKASRELECWRAYERTTFCATDDDGREVCFRVGSKSARLESLLRRHGAATWAFITAWNPASVELSAAENEARQRQLQRELDAAGFKWLPGVGRGDDPAWTPEESVLALGIARAKAVALGRAFGQLAIVAGRRGAPGRLVSCAPPEPRPR